MNPEIIPPDGDFEAHLVEVAARQYRRALRTCLQKFDELRRELALAVRRADLPPLHVEGRLLASGEEWRHNRPIIYGLADPRNPELVRYVGQTVNWPERYVKHCRHYEQARGEWLTELRSNDLFPDMLLLEEVVHCSMLDERETWWVREWWSRGGADLNHRTPRKTLGAA